MKASKLKTVLIIILSIAIIATLCFIWGNSMETVEQSADTSNKAYDTTTDIIVSVGGEPAGEKFQEAISPALFRKFAHAIEYALLSVETSLLFIVIFGFKYKNFLYVPLSCGIVALIDETIQISSGRGSAVVDVWIDLLGACIALALVIGVGSIIKYCLNRKKKKEQNEIKGEADEKTDS